MASLSTAGYLYVHESLCLFDVRAGASVAIALAGTVGLASIRERDCVGYGGVCV